MDIIVFMLNGLIYNYENVVSIRYSHRSKRFYIYENSEEPFIFKKEDVAQIKIKGGYHEHKEG